jgi:hypothetical protein
MGLVRLIQDKAKPNSLRPEELKRSKPVRNPVAQSQELEDGSLAIEAPIEESSSVMGVLARGMKLPAKRQFELDPMGRFVWDLCDGKTTFARIASKLRSQYKMNELEAETALTAYLQTLSKRRLIIMTVKKTA